MTTRRRRRRTPSELAAEAQQRAQAHTDDWGSNAPPRRPRLGHTPDCPNNGRPMRRCSWCRAENLGAEPGQPRLRLAGVVEALRSQPSQPEPAAELRACTTCYRPTDHPTVLCDHCRPGEPT